MHFIKETAMDTTGARDTSDISEISNDEHKVGYETKKNLPTPIKVVRMTSCLA
jgi:hypothetical protein